jgi:hypothetical protein
MKSAFKPQFEYEAKIQKKPDTDYLKKCQFLFIKILNYWQKFKNLLLIAYSQGIFQESL